MFYILLIIFSYAGFSAVRCYCLFGFGFFLVAFVACCLVFAFFRLLVVSVLLIFLLGRLVDWLVDWFGICFFWPFRY